MGQVIVDTSVLVKFMRNPKEGKQLFTKDDEILVTTVALAEIKEGLEVMPPSKYRSKQQEALSSILEIAQVLDFGQKEATQFGVFAAHLLKNGHKMSDFDLAMAAHAATNQAIVLTLDKKAKFDLLPGINVRDF